LKSSRQLSPGDAKIKSWHDGGVEGKANVTRGNAYVGACEIKSGYAEREFPSEKNRAKAKKLLTS
jgi:hypothetical protein